jgi:hypothetical protein
MSDLLDAGLRLDGIWWWLSVLPPVVWSARAVYQRTRPPVIPVRVMILWLLRAAILGILVVLLTEPVLTYFARRVLRPVVTTLVDASPSMEVEEGGVTRLDRIRRTFKEGLGDALVGPVKAFSSSAQQIDPDTLDRLRATGQATNLAAALESAFEATSDPRLLAGIVMMTDGRHNLGADPVRVASEQGTPIHVLGLTSETNPDDVQLVDAVADGQAFAGKPTQLAVRLRSWGFHNAQVTIRLEEGEEILEQVDVILAEDGQTQRLELLTPPLQAGPHLLRVHVVPSAGELTPHNNQSLLSLNVRQSRLRVLLLADRPGAESAFVFRTLVADSTLQIDEYINRDNRTFYQTAAGPQSLDSYDAIVLLAPTGLSMNTVTPALNAYVANGGGLLVQTLGKGRMPDSWTELLPTIMDPVPTEAVRDDKPLHLVPETRSHPLHRGMTNGATGDSWQRLPPLLARASRMRAKPSAETLLAASNGDPVVVVGTYTAGRVVHVLGTGFWRQSLFGEGTGSDARTVSAFWRSAVHWLALAESGGRVRASAERSVFRLGEPVAITAQVFDELNKPLTDAVVELTLSPSGRSLLLEPLDSGRYRTELTTSMAGPYTFRLSARTGATSIGETMGSFLVEDHTVESGDLRSDPEMLAAIAQASGGGYRELEDWRELIHVIRPTPILVREQQDLGVEIRHTGWLVLLTLLLTTEWVLRKRSGML